MKLRKYYRVNKKGNCVGIITIRPDQVAKLNKELIGETLMRHWPTTTIKQP